MDHTKTILLISANAYVNPYPVYPLGISYIYTYLKKRLPQHNIRTFDFNLGSLSDLKVILNDGAFDIVGVSLRNLDDNQIDEKNSFISWYMTVMEVIRDNSIAKVVIGGTGFSIFPGLMFDTLQPDFGIKGEGEESLLQLINCIDSDSDFSKIEGLVYRNPEHEIIVNPRTRFLDSLEL